MKNLLLFIPIFCFMLLFSCNQNDTDIQDLIEMDEALKVGSKENLKRKVDAPGVVPSDNPLLIMNSYVKKYSWRDYSDFLFNELPKYQDEHYYDNLEWMNIRSILSSSSFYEEADADFKEKLWQRISERNFINEPSYAFDLLKSLNANINQTEMANRVHLVVKVNEENFKNNASSLNKHKQAHQKTYAAMNMYLYDRWGKPLFTN